jgi:transcriptional regulator with XRE-family HTH domain
MDRALRRIVASSPPQRSSKRHQELKHHVKSLRELRLIAGKVQADVATALQIKQPSVSKIETQVDMYLSTLRAYVEAIGGELELVIRLRERPVSRLYRLNGALGRSARSPPSGAPGRRRLTAAP